MAAAATYLADKFLNWLKNTAFGSVPTNFYVGLFTSATGPGTEGTEVSGGSYARQAIAPASGWSAISGTPPATPRQVSNGADIAFPAASADWGTITHWVLFDAVTSGNRVAYGAFDTGRANPSGKTFKILAGQLAIKMS